MSLTTYLVDVFAINADGFDHHLGGGCFVADSQENAEQSAAKEFNAHHWESCGHSIAFMTDTPERIEYPKSFSENQAKRMLSELDAQIPFNE